MIVRNKGDVSIHASLSSTSLPNAVVHVVVTAIPVWETGRYALAKISGLNWAKFDGLTDDIARLYLLVSAFARRMVEAPVEPNA